MKWNQKVIKRIACKWQLYLLAFYYQRVEFNYWGSFDKKCACINAYFKISKQATATFLLSAVHFLAHSFLKPGQSKNPCETVQVFRCCCEMIAGGYVGPINVFKVTGEFLLCSQLTQSAHMAEGSSSTELIRLSGSIGLTVDSPPPMYRWSDLRLPTVLELLLSTMHSPYVL